MSFIDFDSIKSSTAAMMKFQGESGLVIDYDKDLGVAGKRTRENEEKTQRSLGQASSASYYCRDCGTKSLQTSGKLLSAMPTRSTGAVVVDEQGGALLQLLLEPSAKSWPLLIKREKGTERQYWLACRSCEAELAYRSTPEASASKFLYVDATAVRERPPTAPEMLERKRQRSVSAAGASYQPSEAS